MMGQYNITLGKIDFVFFFCIGNRDIRLEINNVCKLHIYVVPFISCIINK